MTVTSANTALTKAENRRRYHWAQIDSADRLRSKVWRAAGWFLAELHRRPKAEQEEAVAELVQMASVLNERNGGDDYS